MSPLTRCLLLPFGLVAAVSALAAGDFTNFETPQVHPIDLSPSGQWLAVCNTADDRVEIFDLSSGTPVSAFSVFVGIDPVSARFRTDTELWVVNQISDSVSVVDVSARVVIDTLATKDEPADVVFAGATQKAYVSCSQANTIQVFNPANRSTAPTNIAILGEDPRALAVSTDGLTVYAAVYESGNQTTILGGGNETILFPVDDPVSDSGGPYGGVNPPPNSGTGFSPGIKTAYLPGGNQRAPKVGLIVKRNSSGNWMDDNNHSWNSYVNGPTNWGHSPTWTLLDHDVARINTGNNTVQYSDGLMNICMAIGVNPISGNVHVVGTDAINEVRFEPNVNGIFVRVKLGRFTTGAPTSPTITDLNSHLNYASSTTTATERNKSIGDPRAIAWRADGARGYVAGMGSNNIIVIDANGARVGSGIPINVGEGPTGIAVDNARHQLYVLNRFEGTVSIVNITTETETGRVSFFDPTPAAIRDGRPFLFDTHLTSGLGQVSCGSCHVDARMDRLAWDLGDPLGDIKPLNGTPGEHNLGSNIDGFNVASQYDNFHPMKGPMLTQTLQDIIGKEPFHWRGDKDGIEQFNPAFVSLQGRSAQLTAQEMAAFKAYLATIYFPPNPFRNLDNTLPTNLALPGQFRTGKFGNTGQPLPNGNAVRGLTTLYRPLSRQIDGVACVTCHTLPVGNGSDFLATSSNTSGGTLFINFSPTPLPAGPNGERHHFLVPGIGTTQHIIDNSQLRNMYDRVGYDATQTQNIAGFGFLHDGSVDSLARFMDEFGVTNDQDEADLVALMMAFSGSDFGTPVNSEPPGTASQDAPASVGRQVTLFNGTIPAPLTVLIGFAESGKVDLVAKSVIGGTPRGWLYKKGGGGSNGTQKFLADSAGVEETLNTILGRATTAIPVTFTVVMPGNGTRIGIDRDRDGIRDFDEVRDLLPNVPGWQNPFNPTDPDSTGSSGGTTSNTTSDGADDFDGDGFSNATELANATNPVDNLVASPPLVAHAILQGAGSSIIVEWEYAPLGEYQVQYSPDLVTWTDSPTGVFNAPVGTGTAQWIDNGPTATPSPPNTVPRRFYRVVRIR